MARLELGPEAQGPGVVVHVVPHEGGDEVVAVVVQRLHPQLTKQKEKIKWKIWEKFEKSIEKIWYAMKILNARNILKTRCGKKQSLYTNKKKLRFGPKQYKNWEECSKLNLISFPPNLKSVLKKF